MLLVLDDLWDREQEEQLNFTDPAAGARVLISCRVAGLLKDAHQQQVGLPSMTEAQQILMAAAGGRDGNAIPSGCEELATLCERLPLCLSMAGGLVQSAGFSNKQDWGEITKLVLDEAGDWSSNVECVIRASLKKVKGSEEEQLNVRNTFQLFALVPEDTHCPLVKTPAYSMRCARHFMTGSIVSSVRVELAGSFQEMLSIMHSALFNGGAATPISLIRKWLRVLIRKSLVLGTVRPHGTPNQHISLLCELVC